MFALKRVIFYTKDFDAETNNAGSIYQNSFAVLTPLDCTTLVAHSLAKIIDWCISLVFKNFTQSDAMKVSPAPHKSFISTFSTV